MLAFSCKSRFLKVEPPSDADIAVVLQKISRRVIRALRQWGYLETGIDAVATGYDPLRDDEPDLACTMAASVTQRIAFGERAGQHVRRIGSGFGDEEERPALTGHRCASVNGFSLHANTQVPAHRRDQLERVIWIISDGDVTMPMHNPPHPGLTVRHDCLESPGLTVTEGAKVLGVTRQALNNLVNGKAGISPEMAVRLSKAFGTTPETWLRLHMAYDLAQVRQQKISVKRVARRAVTDDLHP